METGEIAPVAGKRFRRFLPPLLLLIAGVAACGCGGGSSSHPPPKTWTFLIYMDGDNNLSSNALADILQMEKTGSGQYVNIIVELSLPAYTAKRYRIVKGGWEQLADLGQLHLAASQPLTDFLQWGAAAYPADNMVVILWDHGFGWDKPALPLKTAPRSMFTDQSNGNISLSNYQVRQAVENAHIRIDLLGLDESEMGTMEALYEFRNLAPIAITCQETGFQDGWDYAALFADLAGNPGMSTDDLARAVVNAYRQQLENGYYLAFPNAGKIFNIAAIHTAHLDALAREVDALATSLTAGIADPARKSATLSSITAARATVQTVVDTSGSAGVPHVYVDLSDLAAKLDGTSRIPGIVAQTVFAEYHGSAEPNDHGISIVFFKLPNAQQANTYDANYRNWDSATGAGNHGAFVNTYNWDEFLKAYYVAQGFLPQ